MQFAPSSREIWGSSKSVWSLAGLKKHRGKKIRLVSPLTGPISVAGKTGLSGLGDDASDSTDTSSFWTDLANALPAIAKAGAQVYTSVSNANTMQAMAAKGIYPTSYAGGVPQYYSPPAGVTPVNPYSLPSGYALPAGVTPNYALPSPYGYQAPTLSNSLVNDPNFPYYLMGGSLLLVLLMSK